MLKRTKQLLAIMAFTAMVLLLADVSYAQPGMGKGPPNPPPKPCKGGPCPIPIDGGIGLLIAAGVAYGGKKLYDWRKK